MNNLQCRPGPLRRAWQRTLDGDRPWGSDVDRLKVLAGRLLDADDGLSSGRLAPAEHEMVWWGVYYELSRRAVNR